MIDKDDPRHIRLREALRDIRKGQGVTQKQLAERLKKPQSHISKIENGDRNVDVVQLLVMLDVLNMDSDEVIVELFRKIANVQQVDY